MIDHLVYACPDLPAGIHGIEKVLGVAPSPGGVHPQWGTRNALLALGDRTYLEIIAPDPERADYSGPRPFGINQLSAPALVTWAAAPTDIDAVVKCARHSGYEPGEIVDGRRERPDGVVLSWRLTAPTEHNCSGLVPFLIAWGDCPHPAASSAQGCTLLELRARHPEPARVQHALSALGVDLSVETGERAQLIARIQGPKGVVELQ